ncbi:MAG: hypothetical protein EAZ57_01740 [Cytophagales bacterium]|nr:MAG: hypothetical protein EAZ67_02850 [Cytophagales bacterium]TAF61846.1 MAG: hypothetical protein EAZ57_01740 [Cytophagales bacterium]
MRTLHFLFVVIFILLLLAGVVHKSHAQTIIHLKDNASKDSIIFANYKDAVFTNDSLSIYELWNCFKSDLRNFKQAKDSATARYAWYIIQIVNDTQKPFQHIYVDPFVHFGTTGLIYKVQKDSSLFLYKSQKMPLPYETDAAFNTFTPKIELHSDTTTLFVRRESCPSCFRADVGICPNHKLLSYRNTTPFLDRWIWGAMLALIIYNTVLYAMIRDRAYLYYVMAVTFMIIKLTSNEILILASKFYNTDLIFLWNEVDYLTATLSVLFFLYFIMSFLNIQQRSPKWYIYFKWFSVAMLLINIQSLLFNAFDIYNDDYIPGNINYGIAILSLWIYTYLQWRKKYLLGTYLMYANSIGFVCFIYYIAFALKLVPYSFLAANSLKIGSALQMLGFSIALAGRINFLKKEIESKQKEKEALEKQKIIELQQITEQKNVELEHKVKERTNDLSIAVEKLNQSYEEIQTTLDTLQEQSFIINKKNEDITASINYAKRIQAAMLPQEVSFKQAFGSDNYFILYHPRDIVSGDFYWLSHNAKDQESIVVAADCTGHGVPGAFMSMIGMNLLEEIVNVRKNFAPSRILQELDREVRHALKQQETSTNDGMDMAVLYLNQTQNEATFAGAINSVHFISENDTELITLRGSKRSIGGQDKTLSERHFEEHHISLQSTTLFYMASDGFQDQFGGPKDRKFTSRQLKDVLKANAAAALYTQKQILENTFFDWKGHSPQIDDVMLLGFKVTITTH